MTKIATATTAMRLHQIGVLDLDAPIGTYLPGYRPHTEHGHPTTRQLLTHTAGLSNPLPVRWVRPEGQPENAAVIPGHRQARNPRACRRPPGRSYSNIGYLLAGEVIAAASGHSVEDTSATTCSTAR